MYRIRTLNNTNKHMHPIKVFVCYRPVCVSVRHRTDAPQTYTNTLNKYTYTHAPPITCFVSSIDWLVMCVYMSEVSNVRATHLQMYLTQIQTHTRTRTHTHVLTHTHSYLHLHTHSDAPMHTNTYPGEVLLETATFVFVCIFAHILYTCIFAHILYTNTHIHTCTDARTHIHTCTDALTHTTTHTHTYTHTHTWRRVLPRTTPILLRVEIGFQRSSFLSLLVMKVVSREPLNLLLCCTYTGVDARTADCEN